MSDEIVEKLIEEAKRIEEDSLFSSKGHYNDADKWKTVHYWIGILTAILAALGSASAFYERAVWAGVIGIIVTFLTALATFLDPIGKQNNHKSAADAYGALSNQARIFYEIEIKTQKSQDKLYEQLQALASRRDNLNATSPNITRKAYLKARQDIEGGTNTYKVDKE